MMLPFFPHTLTYVYTLSFFAVSATIDNDIQSVTITAQESASFICTFSKGDLEISVYWTVDFEEYNCIAEDNIGSESIECYNTESQSVLLIRNTSSFTPGRHQVECNLQNGLSEVCDKADKLTRRAFFTTGEFM